MGPTMRRRCPLCKEEFIEGLSNIHSGYLPHLAEHMEKIALLAAPAISWGNEPMLPAPAISRRNEPMLPTYAEPLQDHSSSSSSEEAESIDGWSSESSQGSASESREQQPLVVRKKKKYKRLRQSSLMT